MSRAKTRAGTTGGSRATTKGGSARRTDDSVITLGDDQLVEMTELPDLPALRFAIHETHAHLPAAQAAIAAAGHSVIAAAAGRDSLDRIAQLVSRGTVNAVLVGLPGGEPIIDAARALAPNQPVTIAAGTGADAITRALAAGADLAAPRPHDGDRLAPILLAAARAVHLERQRAANAVGSEAVLRARFDQLSRPQTHSLQPFELFQRVLELELKRARRYQYPLAVGLFAIEIPPPPPPAGVRGTLRTRCGNAIIRTIRDIDLATELDHERFLVLLPYTDLTGAAGLGRRASIDHRCARRAGGRRTARTFVPKVVGAVAQVRARASRRASRA